jgi:hypothetical protein
MHFSAWRFACISRRKVRGAWPWPVIASVGRVLVIVVGCVLLAGGPDTRPEHFYWLIAAGMVVQALVRHGHPVGRLDRGR